MVHWLVSWPHKRARVSVDGGDQYPHLQCRTTATAAPSPTAPAAVCACRACAPAPACLPGKAQGSQQGIAVHRSLSFSLSLSLLCSVRIGSYLGEKEKRRVKSQGERGWLQNASASRGVAFRVCLPTAQISPWRNSVPFHTFTGSCAGRSQMFSLS